MTLSEADLEDRVVVITGAARGMGLALTCDVASPDDVARAFRATIEQFGRIDVLVNNAATSSADKPRSSLRRSRPNL